jgi:hypothetical protein
MIVMDAAVPFERWLRRPEFNVAIFLAFLIS